MLNFVRNLLSKRRERIRRLSRIHSQVSDIRDILISKELDHLSRGKQNPFCSHGLKCFSQSDEDGLTLEIIRRIGLTETGGVYAEFGVADGMENNTLILAALGWKGFWAGCEELAFDHSKSKKFFYNKGWITLDNIVSIVTNSLKKIEAEKVNVLSLDLDGNDFYFVSRLLENGTKPDLFIVEYNSKFPPPIEFVINYDEGHQWRGDDYYGASLQSFVNLFQRHGYSIVCCNFQSGVNAFFVKNDHKHLFPEVPDDINNIYVGPKYRNYKSFGHRPAPSTVESFFN